MSQLHPKGSIHASENSLSPYCRCLEVNSQCFFLVGVHPYIPSHLSAAASPAMLASSSTLEKPRVSPRTTHGFPKRQSPSPLSNSHTIGTFISPSMDSLIQDSSQPKPSKPRRKGLSWNPWWHAGRNGANSSTGLIPPPGEIEKAEGNRAKPLKTPWHHGWRTALFGTCTPPIRSSI